jgi:hypothetical protein
MFLALWYTPTSIACAVSQCFVDIVRTEDFRDSQRDGGPRSYVRDILQSYSFNYDPGAIEIRIRKAHDCVVRDGSEVYDGAIVRAEVIDMLSDPSEALPPINRNDCYLRYLVPVARRAALVRMRYISSELIPGGTGVETMFTIRNLSIIIAPPAGTSVLPTREEVAPSIYRSYGRIRDGRLLIQDQKTDSCRPIEPAKPADPYKLFCPAIWLLRAGYYPLETLFSFSKGDVFMFCFAIPDWMPIQGSNIAFRCMPSFSAGSAASTK